MLETFDTKELAFKEVLKFVIGELVWFKMQRQIPHMNIIKQNG